jgi:hypothetical protein
MRDRPSGADLLDEARRVLLDELLPDLAAEERYKALMIARAMAIAGRELEAGEAPLAAERQRLAALLDGEAALETLQARLAGEIRDGAWDGDAAAHEALTASARWRLSESDPKALERIERATGGKTEEDR